LTFHRAATAAGARAHNNADRLFIDQIEEELVNDDKLQMQAQNNTIDNCQYGFDEAFLSPVDRTDGREPKHI